MVVAAQDAISCSVHLRCRPQGPCMSPQGCPKAFPISSLLHPAVADVFWAGTNQAPSLLVNLKP